MEKSMNCGCNRKTSRGLQMFRFEPSMLPAFDVNSGEPAKIYPAGKTDPMKIDIGVPTILELDFQESGDDCVVVSPNRTFYKKIGPGEKLPILAPSDFGTWRIYRSDSGSRWDRCLILLWGELEAKLRNSALWWNP